MYEQKKHISNALVIFEPCSVVENLVVYTPASD